MFLNSMNKKQTQKRLRVILWSLFLIPGLATPCLADAGIPMIIFEFPLVLLMLIPVILIEVIIFRRRLNYGLGKIGLSVTVVNLITTFIGYPLGFLLRLMLGSFFLRVIALPYAIFLLLPQAMATTLLGLTSPIVGALGIIFFSLIGFAPPEMDESISSIVFMVSSGMIGLLFAFPISVFVEGFLLQKIFFRSEDKKKIMNLTWKANIRSYLLLTAWFLFVIVRLVCIELT